jgi:hypothetical protein
MTQYWCGVVSREHGKASEEGGFCQIGSGRRGPIARMADGDGIVLYSPLLQYGGKEKCQSFTAIGTVAGAQAYMFNLTPTFAPYRRDVLYRPSQDAPIHPLLDQLAMTAGFANWGFKFRLGHFEISAADFLLIAAAMQAAPVATGTGQPVSRPAAA